MATITVAPKRARNFDRPYVADQQMVDNTKYQSEIGGISLNNADRALRDGEQPNIPLALRERVAQDAAANAANPMPIEAGPQGSLADIVPDFVGPMAQVVGPTKQLAPQASDAANVAMQRMVDDNLINLDPVTRQAIMNTGQAAITGGVQYTGAAVPGNTAILNMSGKEAIAQGQIPIGQSGVQERLSFATSNRELENEYGATRGSTQGSYKSMSPKSAEEQFEYLRDTSQKLQRKLQEASMSKDPSRPGLSEAGHTLLTQFGQDSLNGTELGNNGMLAYYQALQEAIYADYSTEEKELHDQWFEEKGQAHPDLYETTPDGRNAVEPKRKVLEEGIGKIYEENMEFNFSSNAERDKVGGIIFSAMNELDISDKLINASTMFIDPKQPTKLFNADNRPLNTPTYPIDVLDIDNNYRASRMAATQGLRDLMYPNKRNHVQVVAPSRAVKPNEVYEGEGITGNSPVRAARATIREATAWQFDPHWVKIMETSYRQPGWNEMWSKGDINYSETHFNILMQERDYVAQNGVDGKFWLPHKGRGSARTGDGALAMADMKIFRTSLQGADYNDNVKLSKTTDVAKYNREEQLFVSGSMAFLGADGFQYGEAERLFQQYTLPTFEGRLLGAALNEWGKSGQIPTTTSDGQAFTPERLSAFTSEGGDGLQALRAVDSFFKAKSNPKVNVFLTKFVGEVDASQSGQTIQALQIGYLKGVERGGYRSNKWFTSLDTDANSTADKLYNATRVMARGFYDGAVEVDSVLGELAISMFGDHAIGDESLNDSLFSKRFAKAAVQGASYGQRKPGAIRAVMEEMETVLTEDRDVRLRITDLTSIFPEKGELPGFSGTGTPQVVLDPSTGKVRFNKNTEAKAKLELLASQIVEGMNKADPKILEYSQVMGDIYQSYIKLGLMFKDNGQPNEVIEPKMTYWEPSDPNNIYGGKWVKGISVPMLRYTLPKEMLESMKVGGVDAEGNSWEGLDVHSNAGNKQADWDLEDRVMNDPDAWERGLRSAGFTRFPVISIHGLDDLIISIAIVEMKKKYGDKMPPIQSVWDAGRMPSLMREEFAMKYNEAELAVMKHNRFFDQISEGLQDSLEKIYQNPTLKARIDAKQGAKALRTLGTKIKSLRTKAADYESKFKNVLEAIDHSAVGKTKGMLWAIDPGTKFSGRKDRLLHKPIEESVFGANTNYADLLKSYNK